MIQSKVLAERQGLTSKLRTAFIRNREAVAIRTEQVAYRYCVSCGTIYNTCMDQRNGESKVQPRTLSQMSKHVREIRSLVADVDASLPAEYPERPEVEALLNMIKVECHVLREHLVHWMPLMTDEEIV